MMSALGQQLHLNIPKTLLCLGAAPDFETLVTAQAVLKSAKDGCVSPLAYRERSRKLSCRKEKTVTP